MSKVAVSNHPTNPEVLCVTLPSVEKESREPQTCFINMRVALIFLNYCDQHPEFRLELRRRVAGFYQQLIADLHKQRRDLGEDVDFVSEQAKAEVGDL